MNKYVELSNNLDIINLFNQYKPIFTKILIALLISTIVYKFVILDSKTYIKNKKQKSNNMGTLTEINENNKKIVQHYKPGNYYRKPQSEKNFVPAQREGFQAGKKYQQANATFTNTEEKYQQANALFTNTEEKYQQANAIFSKTNIYNISQNGLSKNLREEYNNIIKQNNKQQKQNDNKAIAIRRKKEKEEQKRKEAQTLAKIKAEQEKAKEKREKINKEKNSSLTANSKESKIIARSIILVDDKEADDKPINSSYVSSNQVQEKGYTQYYYKAILKTSINQMKINKSAEVIAAIIDNTSENDIIKSGMTIFGTASFNNSNNRISIIFSRGEINGEIISFTGKAYDKNKLVDIPCYYDEKTMKNFANKTINNSIDVISGIGQTATNNLTPSLNNLYEATTEQPEVSLDENTILYIRIKE